MKTLNISFPLQEHTSFPFSSLLKNEEEIYPFLKQTGDSTGLCQSFEHIHVYIHYVHTYTYTYIQQIDSMRITILIWFVSSVFFCCYNEQYYPSLIGSNKEQDDFVFVFQPRLAWYEEIFEMALLLSFDQNKLFLLSFP